LWAWARVPLRLHFVSARPLLFLADFVVLILVRASAGTVELCSTGQPRAAVPTWLFFFFFFFFFCLIFSSHDSLLFFSKGRSVFLLFN